MLVSQLDDLDQELIALRDWVESGGYVQFALTLQKSSHLSLIEQALETDSIDCLVELAH